MVLTVQSERQDTLGADGADSYARLLDRLKLRDRQIHTALAISEALTSSIDVDDVLQETLRLALATVNAGAGSVILYDSEKDRLVFRHALPESSADLISLEMRPAEGIVGRAFKTGRTQITESVEDEPSHRQDIAELVSYRPRNAVSVPLKDSGAPIGVLQVLDALGGEFDQEACELLEIVAAQASSMVTNARLAEEARLAAVMNYVGDISHDIKTMLTPVESCAQTMDLLFEQAFQDMDAALQRRSGIDPKAAADIASAVEMLRAFYPDAVQMLLDGASNVQHRVREIADCVKGIVAEPAFELVDARTIAQQVYQPAAMVADRAGVTLRLELPEDLPPAYLDQKRMYNAIYNLVNNAIPETPAGGPSRSVSARVRFTDLQFRITC